jgi:hypothetical protein
LSKSHDFRFFFPLQSDNLGPNFSPKNPSLKSHKLFVKWQNLAKTNIVVALSYSHLWFIVQFASGSLQSYILKNSVLTKREICVRMCSCVCVCIIIIVAFILNFCWAINSLKPPLSVTIILALMNTERQIFNQHIISSSSEQHLQQQKHGHC